MSVMRKSIVDTTINRTSGCEWHSTYKPREGITIMKMPEGLNQVNLRVPDELLARIKLFQLDLSKKRGKLHSMHSIIVEAIAEKIARGQ
jgi:hypothetical protein